MKMIGPLADLNKSFYPSVVPFTSADNYILNISESVPKDHVARQLILPAVMCIDIVLKE